MVSVDPVARAVHREVFGAQGGRDRGGQSLVVFHQENAHEGKPRNGIRQVPRYVGRLNGI